jgi:stringent starvation protein B
MTAAEMTSNRPYLLRALHEWISDNGLTPYLLVDAAQPGVRVPATAIKDDRVVLNVADRAVTRLSLGPERVQFLARFGGASQSVDLPVSAVLAIYARENGQGMMFPAEGAPPPEPPPSPDPDGPPADDGAPKRPHLRVIK